MASYSAAASGSEGRSGSGSAACAEVSVLGCSEDVSEEVEVVEGSDVAGASEDVDDSDGGVADVALDCVGVADVDCVDDGVGVTEGEVAEVGPGAGPSVGSVDGVGEVMTALSVQATQR
jgi:hypothetical protein